jgi:hypothetical protein
MQNYNITRRCLLCQRLYTDYLDYLCNVCLTELVVIQQQREEREKVGMERRIRRIK